MEAGMWILALCAVLLLSAAAVRRSSERRETGGWRMDSVLLSVPSVALAECRRQTLGMLEQARDNLRLAQAQFSQYDDSAARCLLLREHEIDQMEAGLSQALESLLQEALTLRDSRLLTRLHLAVGGIEGLGNCAVRLESLAAKLREQGAPLPPPQLAQLQSVSALLDDFLQQAFDGLLREGAPHPNPGDGGQAKARQAILLTRNGSGGAFQQGRLSAQQLRILSEAGADWEDALTIGCRMTEAAARGSALFHETSI